VQDSSPGKDRPKKKARKNNNSHGVAGAAVSKPRASTAKKAPPLPAVQVPPRGIGPVHEPNLNDVDSGNTKAITEVSEALTDVRKEKGGLMKGEERAPREDAPYSGGGGKRNDNWEQSYQELVGFHAIHGHTNIPQDKLKALYQWTLRQKHRRTGSCTDYGRPLTHDQIRKLDAIGFDWTIKNMSWEQSYQELVGFHAIHGHTNIPRRDKLNQWAYRQKLRRSGSCTDHGRPLTQDQIRKLDAIGFNWAIKKQKREKRVVKLARTAAVVIVVE